MELVEAFILFNATLNFIDEQLFLPINFITITKRSVSYQHMKHEQLVPPFKRLYRHRFCANYYASMFYNVIKIEVSLTVINV